MPTIARSRLAAERSTATSRRAASGATREALTAGATLASSVVTMPDGGGDDDRVDADDEAADREVEPRAGQQRVEPGGQTEAGAEADGRGDDADDEALRRRRPSTTWRRDAPIARSSADSRVRWATRIENVLWMLKVATTSAIPAKARRITSNMPRKSDSMSASCSAVSSCCVSASMRAGSSWAISSRSVVPLTPSSAATSTLESASGRSSSRLRAASSVNAV